MTFPDTTLSHPQQILLATDELASGERLDPHSIDSRRIELPIEVDQRFAFSEAGLTDAVDDPSFATPVGLLANHCS
jgi:hypothetical protein